MLTKKLSTKVFFGLICRPLSVRRGRVFFVEFFPGAFSSSVAPTKSLFGWSSYCRAPSSTKHCWMSFFGIQAIAFGRQVCTFIRKSTTSMGFGEPLFVDSVLKSLHERALWFDTCAYTNIFSML